MALTILRAAAVVSSGLLAGIFFGHRAGVQQATPALSPSGFVQLQQIIHAQYVVFMPPLVLAALVSSVLWAVMRRSQWRNAEFWLVALSATAIFVIAAATRAVNVPLNDELMTWSVASPPPNLRELWAPWERVNTLRSVLATGALVLEAVALAMGASGTDAGRRE
jgi:uncharacterized membrane protein